MDYRDRDAALEKLGKLGKAGGIPISNPSLAVDELQRRTSTVAQIVAELLSDNFRGPRFATGADIFTIDCRSGGNIISSTIASQEGFGSTSNLAIFRHGKGFVLDYYVVIQHFLKSPAVGPPNRLGNVQVFGFDDNRTAFQADQDALTQEAVITVACWSSKQVPANQISPRATGAARGPHGYIEAKA